MFQTWNFKSFPKQTHVKWHTLYCFNVRLAKNILAISVTRKTHLNCGLNDLKPWDPSQQTQELHQESVLRHQHLSLSFKCRFREFKFLHINNKEFILRHQHLSLSSWNLFFRHTEVLHIMVYSISYGLHSFSEKS